jgi:hypothetical protein
MGGAGGVAHGGVLGVNLGGITNMHSTEEGAGSGLSLSTNNSYSMPHTLEDFLGANFDDMDSTGWFSLGSLMFNFNFSSEENICSLVI